MHELYHHTDSARLPWILRDQTLKPIRNYGCLPEPDFLWATTDPMGDSTATSSFGNDRAAYRDGNIAAVRFTLDEADFTPWTVARTLYPQWTPRHCAALENGVPPGQVARWRCRVEPLDASRWLAVEYRTWRNPRWRPVTPDVLCIASDAPDVLGVRLDGVIFASRQEEKPGQPTRYDIWKAAL